MKQTRQKYQIENKIWSCSKHELGLTYQNEIFQSKRRTLMTVHAILQEKSGKYSWTVACIQSNKFHDTSFYLNNYTNSGSDKHKKSQLLETRMFRRMFITWGQSKLSKPIHIPRHRSWHCEHWNRGFKSHSSYGLLSTSSCDEPFCTSWTPRTRRNHTNFKNISVKAERECYPPAYV